ncbi:TPA: type II toxin-antitoxin system RelB/DinJ family antitoxin [Pseudomonas aeruginosa]|nr:type II toxin-antitoxin system RelB/DinJ family antitoxin [Pseudomonas aeruginosa]
MPANVVVRARIDGQIKEEAAIVLAAIGLTVSDAFRIMLTRVASEKALPFEPLIPSATTIEEMKGVHRTGQDTAGALERPFPPTGKPGQ